MFTHCPQLSTIQGSKSQYSYNKEGSKELLGWARNGAWQHFSDGMKLIYVGMYIYLYMCVF